MMVAEVAIRLGLLSLGNHARLELCHVVVDPGSVGRSQSIYSRPVGGATGITPTHNACQIPEAVYGTREWASRVTLASILASLNIASAQHVLLDSVGFFRHCINVVQAATGFTADEWYLKLLQRPRGLEAH